MLDIAKNRQSRKYTPTEQVKRVLWSAAAPLFHLSPRLAYGWRNALLRMFGARIGRSVRIYPSAVVFFPWNLQVGDETTVGPDVLIYNLGPVALGRQVTVSHRAQICAGTHDHRQRDFPLLKPAVRIGDASWICTQAFVGPGISVGEGAVVGACAVATRDVPPWTVVAGNPARPVSARHLHS